MPKIYSRVVCDVDFDKDGKQSGYLRVPNSTNESAYGTILIPIWVVKNGDGPTVLFTSGIHGDEYEGPVALGRVVQRLEPEAIAGTVIIIPCVNVPAFLNGTRLSPLDNLNLNRIFPGDALGSVSMVIAHYIDAILLPRANYQIDYHSGGKSA